MNFVSYCLLGLTWICRDKICHCCGFHYKCRPTRWYWRLIRITLKLYACCWTMGRTPISAVNMQVYLRHGLAGSIPCIMRLILKLWTCWSMLEPRWRHVAIPIWHRDSAHLVSMPPSFYWRTLHRARRWCGYSRWVRSYGSLSSNTLW